MDSNKTHKAFVQMAMGLQETSGHNVVCLVHIQFPMWKTYLCEAQKQTVTEL